MAMCGNTRAQGTREELLLQELMLWKYDKSVLNYIIDQSRD